MKSLLVWLMVFAFAGVYYSALAEASRSDLGFRNIILGMNHDELIKTLKSDDDLKNFREIGKRPFIAVSPDHIYIGSKGSGESEIKYIVEKIFVNSFEGKVSRISIFSSQVSADELYVIQKWAKFAVKAISEKYGKPKTFKDIDEFNILNLEKDLVAVWDFKTQEIVIRFNEHKSQFEAVITFLDVTAEKKESENQKKVNSNF